ncbi:MAG: FAD-dependent oxidoreductase [Planctomycetes bacterium]|nr:FAD-dependent oxidoreductase [Planctomycetota bacterium]
MAEHLRAHGVEVHLDTEVAHFEAGRDGAVAAIRTTQGGFRDLAVVAIGVAPNTGWLEGSAVDRDRDGGILVDERLQTSAPNVLAAGDCASVPWADGRQRPEPLWYTSRDQGRVAGARLVGEDALPPRHSGNSAKFDLEYTTVGLVRPEPRQRADLAPRGAGERAQRHAHRLGGRSRRRLQRSRPPLGSRRHRPLDRGGARAPLGAGAPRAGRLRHRARPPLTLPKERG